METIENLSEGIFTITGARKAATKEQCKAYNLKKEDLAQKIFKLAKNRIEAEEEERKSKIIAEDMKRLGIYNRTEYIDIRKRDKELTEQLKLEFPYRQATGKWCDPENTIKVKTDVKRCGYGHSLKSYSLNGKWAGKESHYAFHMLKNDMLSVLGGLVTIYDKSQLENDIKQCIWFEQSRGFEIKQKNGFLVSGYHIEAETEEEAKEKALKAVYRAIKKDSEEITKESAHKKFGFCMPGIMQFMSVNKISVEKITFAYLKKIINENHAINKRLYSAHLLRIGIKL